MFFSRFPKVVDENKVGSYEAITSSGSGYFYDSVLEYRVWYKKDGEQYCYFSPTYKDAYAFYVRTEKAEKPLALVLQKKHINEPEKGVFEYIETPRQTEWKTKWLTKSRLRTKKNLEKFNNKHKTNFVI